MAATLCTLMAVPAIVEAVTQALLLFAWSRREHCGSAGSAEGSRVPLVRHSGSWQLSSPAS